MSKNYDEMRNDIREYTKELRNLSPDTMNAFYKLSSSATAEGVLSTKVKEFIAMAISVSQKCDGCIAFHTKNLKELGASREEVAEVLGMNIYMGGGPSLMYAADALRAYDALDG